jgi:hypothetical protein
MMAMGIERPLAATPDDTEQVFWRQEMLVARIGERLALANVSWCPQNQPRTGMILHDIAAYDAAARLEIEQHFELARDFGVRGVIPGNAADNAGLQRGDVIVAVGSTPMSTFKLSLIKKKASFARTLALTGWLTEHLRDGPQVISLRRKGAPITLTLAAPMGCTGNVQLEPSAGFDGWSDGQNVAIGEGILTELPHDDELAFVIAHEMGHNWLDQAARARARLPSSNWLLMILAMDVDEETKADLVAIAAMGRSGYAPDAAINVLDRLAIIKASERGLHSRRLLKRKEILERIMGGSKKGLP